MDPITITLTILSAIGVAYVNYRKAYPPGPSPSPSPSPGPDGGPSPSPGPATGHPILDALMRILAEIQAGKPLSGVNATLQHADGKSYNVSVTKAEAEAPPVIS